jgi:hypothetical protein
LQQQRCFETETVRERGQPRLARETVEHRIEIVQRVPDLVQPGPAPSASTKKRMAPPDSRK